MTETVRAKGMLRHPVIEVFGPVVQGEGALAGAPCHFVRFGGCDYRCSWCVAPETPILMADFTFRPAGELVVGDLVMSARAGKYEATAVSAIYSREATRYKITTKAGREIVATGDHIWRVGGRGATRWRCVTTDLVGHKLRVSKLSRSPVERSEAWFRGWAKGLILGDGHISAGRYPKVRLRVTDEVLARVYANMLNAWGGTSTVKEYEDRTERHKPVYSVVHSLKVAPWLAETPTADEVPGFLAGFFDAEGSCSTGKQAHFSQHDPKTLDRVEVLLRDMGFDPHRGDTSLTVNGRENVCRLFNEINPLLDRKTEKVFTDTPLATDEVISVEPVDDGPVVNVMTGTGLFMPAGALAEQCDSKYAVNPREVKEHAERLTDEEIVERLLALEGSPEWVVLSGGNPALQRLDGLIPLLHAEGFRVMVETQGTMRRPWLSLVDHITVSPKPPSSGMPRVGAEEVLRWLDPYLHDAKRHAVKIVVFDDEDYAYAREVFSNPSLKAYRPRCLDFFLSVGTRVGEDSRDDIVERYRWLLEKTACDPQMGHVRVLPQLHAVVYGHVRGV